MKFTAVTAITTIIAFGEQALAAPPILQKEELARLLDYPAANIRVTDITSQLKKKHGNAIHSSHLFDSADGSFFPVYQVIADAGFLLNEDRKKQLESPGGDVVEAPLAGGGICYFGTMGFGAGGEEHFALAHLPKAGIDVQIKISIPYDRNESGDPALSGYYSRIKESDGIDSALYHSIRHGTQKLASSSSPAVEGLPALEPRTIPASEPNTPINPELIEGSHHALEIAPESTDSDLTISILVSVTLLAASILAFFALRRKGTPHKS